MDFRAHAGLVAMRRLACLAMLLLAAPATAQAVLLDSFDQGQTFIQASAEGASERDVQAVSNVLGGVRDVLLEVQSNPSVILPEPNVAWASINRDKPGIAWYHAESNVDARLTLTYDGNLMPGLQQTGLGGVNLRAGGEFGFNIPLDIAMVGQQVDLTIRVYDMDGDVSEINELLVGDEDPEIEDHFFPFPDDGTDFTNVGAVQVVFDALSGRTDIDIDRIATVVPEPGSLALLGMGALGLAGFGWRRRKSDHSHE